jgi:hypothetical protein
MRAACLGLKSHKYMVSDCYVSTDGLDVSLKLLLFEVQHIFNTSHILSTSEVSPKFVSGMGKMQLVGPVQSKLLELEMEMKVKDALVETLDSDDYVNTTIHSVDEESAIMFRFTG